jgi:ABC-type uncharacterized transport system substrate-binding protein
LTSAAQITVLTPAKTSYVKVACEIDKRLKKAGHSVSIIAFDKGSDTKATRGTSGESNDSDIRSPRIAAQQVSSSESQIVVTVGMTAMAMALDAAPSKRVVFCQVANSADLPFFNGEKPSQQIRIAGVDANISPAENIDWICRFKPRPKRLAVFHSSRTKKTLQGLIDAGRAKGIEIIGLEASPDDFVAAISRLSGIKCDGLIMIPDSRVYNVASIRRVLLWSLRQRKPVWAFSSSVVKAGALSSKHPTDQGAAHEVAELVDEFMSDNSIAVRQLRYPLGDNSAFNERTAEQIGVTADEEILSKITNLYGGLGAK